MHVMEVLTLTITLTITLTLIGWPDDLYMHVMEVETQASEESTRLAEEYEASFLPPAPNHNPN